METEKYRGLIIKIEQDQDPISPREWDTLGTMYCWHRRYNLGDEQPSYDPADFFYHLLEDTGLCDAQQLADDQEQVKQEVNKNYVILPLYLYDHGGLSISTGAFSCTWDSGQVGWIAVSHEAVKREFGEVTPETLEQAEKTLVSEVSVYDDYLTGNVYGFIIETPDGEHVDSCCGFYGGWGKYAFDEAKSVIDDLTDNGKTDHNGQQIMQDIG